ncbi:phospholipase D-like domain-containing protein DpdK [Kineococcus sp. SYSU DK005]|uniref:phospholipase D-like domain-containing protein DpdK n=1 Tax=Kineococcus sp. SYSU DK005 TaxID=3383126 RepID=UPI003D7DED46
MSTRTLRRGRARTTDDLRALLQALFVAEVLQPSREVWLISPWISDIAVIDNTDGGFSALQPDWTARPVRLSEVLLALLHGGSAVFIEVRPDAHNDAFVQRLRAGAAGTGGEERLHLRTSPVLHEKGLLTDQCLLSGSMNLTYNGVQLLDELVQFDTQAEAIAAAHLSFRARWSTS